MIEIKDGVRIRGISPEILLAIQVAESVLEQAEEHLVITSVTDGRHMAGSMHHIGEAFDMRLPMLAEEVTKELQWRLGSAFDVVLEPTHIHVEHDPK